MKNEKLLRINQATEEDSILIWNWRNDLETRKMSKNKVKIGWEEHRRWLKRKLIHEKDKIYILKEEINSIGVIFFSQTVNAEFEVSINLNPAYRSKGYGQKLLQLGIKRFKEENKTNDKIVATIKKINIKSVNLFKKMMFKLERSDENFLYYSLASA